jgi:hypothetical protein
VIDLFEVLKKKGIYVKPHGSQPDEFKICCPFCPEMGRGFDDEFKCGFNIVSGLGHCFRCGWSSRSALLDILHYIGSERYLLEEVGAIDFTKESRQKPDPVEWPSDYIHLRDVDDDDGSWCVTPKRYIVKRGVTRKQMRIHKIGVSRELPKMMGRILFPYWDEKGVLWGFCGRDWTGDNPVKYLNTQGRKVAYNVRHDYPEGKKLIIILEGVVKALAVERATEYKVCCSATLGSNATDIQYNQFKKFDEACFFPDPDAPGMVGVLSMMQNLEPLIKKVTMAWPWPKKQADEMEPKEILDALEERRWISPPRRLLLKQEMRDR